MTWFTILLMTLWFGSAALSLIRHQINERSGTSRSTRRRDDT